MSTSPSGPRRCGGGSTQPAHSPLPPSMCRTQGEGPKGAQGPGLFGRPRGADPGLTTPSHGEILRHEALRCPVVSTPTPEDTDLCVCPDESVRQSVMSDSLQPHGMQLSRLPCPWDSPDKNTGVRCHALLQEIFPTQGSNPGLSNRRQILYRLSHQGSPSWCYKGMSLVPSCKWEEDQML